MAAHETPDRPLLHQVAAAFARDARRGRASTSGQLVAAGDVRAAR